ncbi:hypothetical protein [Streptacidiphilus cavernicola]|uniref:ATP-grasp-modified RiPP n=1 Tax=Streptacidiphilus cavernicola TaxID=3342716 RepID=A0ABV6W266_9ACTN
MPDRPNWLHMQPTTFGRAAFKPVQEALILDDPGPDAVGTAALPGLGGGDSLFGGADHEPQHKVSHS